MTKWIRARDIPTLYPVGKTYTYELLKRFFEETDPANWIRDGRVTIVKQEEFETWWREHGRRRS